jgi:hypothetical protein
MILRTGAAAFLALCAAGAGATSPSEAQAGIDFVSGQRYYTGDGVPQNYTRAALLFRRAAGNGHPYAQFMLGLMLENGYGVDANLPEARLWYRRAAEQGESRAQRRLHDLGEALPPVATDPVVPPSATRAPAAVAMTPAPADGTPTPVAAAAVPRPTAAPSAPVPTPTTPQVPAPAPPAASEPEPAYAAPVPLAPLAAYTPLPKAETPVTPPPAERPRARAPALRVVLPLQELSPITADAVRQYRDAMAAADYGSALRALEQAREDGIPALGLDEPHTARELARLALLSDDAALARVYLQQASTLGAPRAEEAWTRLAAGADASAVAELLID